MSVRPSLATTRRLVALLLAITLLLAAFARPAPAASEGSVSLFPINDPTRFRANLEWRNSVYGFSADSPEFNLQRRTLLKLYANAGEQILVGSSGINIGAGPDIGDVRIYVPSRPGFPDSVSGPIGQETILPLAGAPALPQAGAFANGFSCVAQRATAGNAGRGRIASRAIELVGPNTEDNDLPAGYTPCIYTAPFSGVYNVVFLGPDGDNTDNNPVISGALNSPPADFGQNQRSTVTAWDVTVRTDANTPTAETGRLFLYYFAGITGANGRNVLGTGFVVTSFGFQYRVSYGADPFGFILYANQFGFQNSDGTPLYHNLLADPTVPTQDQNQLRELQGGARLLPPVYPIFFDRPYEPALDAIGIPRTPVGPAISVLTFSAAGGGTVAPVGVGGTFRFQTTQPGVYKIVISRDGVDFDPENPQNRLLRGIATTAGPIDVPWDGKDNAKQNFPEGTFSVRAAVQGGESHFPFLDVENNTPGSPIVELINPPDLDGNGVGDCPPWNGGCFGAFYDDAGYRTANDVLVGTAVGGPLCPGDAANPRGFGNPPLLIASDVDFGYDTRTTQRAFGFNSGGNPAMICDQAGGFGDKKGLDLWTFYPSNLLEIQLQIVGPTAVTLTSFSAARTGAGVAVRWTTGVELDTQGFHLLRGTSPDQARAARITAAPVPARGGAATGASYSWTDATAEVGPVYYYWLEELTASGPAHVYGPAIARPATSALRYQVWLPLLRSGN